MKTQFERVPYHAVEPQGTFPIGPLLVLHFAPPRDSEEGSMESQGVQQSRFPESQEVPDPLYMLRCSSLLRACLRNDLIAPPEAFQ